MRGESAVKAHTEMIKLIRNAHYYARCHFLKGQVGGMPR